MKGVLFSADFAIDNNGNPRLLELNTDTVVYPAFTSSIAFNNLTDVINANPEITEFHIVHKRNLHDNIVSLFSSSVASDCTNVVKYGTTLVDQDSSYPTVPADSGSKFILRLAYDENAVFDSTYAKNNVNTLKLMYDNNATSSIGELYHSSSTAEINTLTGNTGSSAYLPDYVVKSKASPAKDMRFYIASSSVNTAAEVVNLATGSVIHSEYIEKYYYDSNIISNNKVSGLRSYNIMYGTNLDVIKLVSGSYDAIFNFDTGSNWREYGSTEFSTIPRKHFYQFTNKFPQTRGSDGIIGEESIQKIDGTFVSASLIESGSWVKSFFYNGLPDTDDMDLVDAWSKVGYDTPSGSFERSASVHSVFSSSVSDSGMNQLEIDGLADLLNIGVNTRIMVYSTSSNMSTIKQAREVLPGEDFIVEPISGSLYPISNNYFAVKETIPTFHAIDIEPDDIYFIKVGGIGVKVTVTVHNNKPI